MNWRLICRFLPLYEGSAVWTSYGSAVSVCDAACGYPGGGASLRAAIATYGLAKVYPTGVGVAGVSFAAMPGEVIGLLGPPASGKSTLLSLLATRLPATHGSLAVMGRPVPAYRPQAKTLTSVRRELGVLLEEVPVAGDLSGWNNAWLLGRLYGLPPAELNRRLQTLFAWMNFEPLAHRPARSYTYPLRRKLGLVQALLPDPNILLLDEPFHCLDGSERLALHEALLHARQKGATVIMALGHPADARSLCTRVLLMDSGKVVADGPAADLLHSLGRWTAIEVRLGGHLSELDLAPVPGLQGNPEFGNGSLRVRVHDPETALPPLLACIAKAGGRVFAVDVRSPLREGRL